MSTDPVHHKHRLRRTRALDVVLVVLSAPVWVTMVVVVGAAVACTSGRPILFRQARIGRNDAPFEMIKFRSMVDGDNPLIPDPSRITRIGHILRRTSLDELPQLLHVVRGEMSLVGPRPMLPEQVDALSPNQRARSIVRPGMTGLAQVNGRNDLRWDDRIDHDLEWVANHGLRLYLATLGRTLRVVVRGDGVSGHDPDDRFVDLDAQVIRLVDFDLTHLNDDQRAA